MRKHLHTWTLSHEGESWFRPEENASRDLQRPSDVALAQAVHEPESRAAKIERIRAAIANGTYFVSAEALAEKLEVALT